MKITAIELSEKEINEVVDYLTSKFKIDDSKQKVELDLYDCIEDSEYEFHSRINIECELKLSTYYYEPDENNQTSIENRYCHFRITFFYDGEQIKENAYKIYELINKYYQI